MIEFTESQFFPAVQSKPISAILSGGQKCLDDIETQLIRRLDNCGRSGNKSAHNLTD